MSLPFINPVEQINKAIPELAQIQDRPNNLEYINFVCFNTRMKRIERHNLKAYGRSLSWCGIIAYFNPAIVELRDGKIVVLNKKKYQLIAKWLKAPERQLKQEGE